MTDQERISALEATIDRLVETALPRLGETLARQQREIETLYAALRTQQVGLESLAQVPEQHNKLAALVARHQHVLEGLAGQARPVEVVN